MLANSILPEGRAGLGAFKKAAHQSGCFPKLFKLGFLRPPLEGEG